MVKSERNWEKKHFFREFYVELTMKAPATSMLARLLVFPRPKWPVIPKNCIATTYTTYCPIVSQ